MREKLHDHQALSELMRLKHAIRTIKQQEQTVETILQNKKAPLTEDDLQSALTVTCSWKQLHWQAHQLSEILIEKGCIIQETLHGFERSIHTLEATQSQLIFYR